MSTENVKTVTVNEINPFGKITDYLSVGSTTYPGDEDVFFSVSDGTTTLYLTALSIEPSCNHSKPHQVNGRNGYILLTSKQLETLLTQYLRLFARL